MKCSEAIDTDMLPSCDERPLRDYLRSQLALLELCLVEAASLSGAEVALPIRPLRRQILAQANMPPLGETRLSDGRESLSDFLFHLLPFPVSIPNATSESSRVVWVPYTPQSPLR